MGGIQGSAGVSALTEERGLCHVYALPLLFPSNLEEYFGLTVSGQEHRTRSPVPGLPLKLYVTPGKSFLFPRDYFPHLQNSEENWISSKLCESLINRLEGKVGFAEILRVRAACASRT